MKANYDEIKIRVPKGKKEVIQAHAESQKESTNAFIGRAIDEAIARDTKKE
jgi:predicted HicB family RNase H-like nuclease